ncbi:hypothetical protein PPACK8108_LOCUS626 [Phakopsora pachyrhizi]|uniref:DNA mismatch repair protein S5 domain-containing protein n=1 Tax=Phakopsora pachyrhizi TaxID=170000 RepID=A0AAV0AGL0_PHAPC|nr:hypothetical protein PPACK8108_LOCUS626 [Phakopsora pachyrhizi]
MLSIQDNGSGIRRADLPILCERFTTSKIRKFDDLSRLKTYGFRGEALASISHVAHLTVATKVRDDSVGWKAQYSDGKLVPLKPGGTAEPQPCAGNNGTVITVEDMFYNVPQRRKALQTASDEYKKILDVTTKYAVHNQGVAISCKKANSPHPDVNSSMSATTLETIGRLYGETLKKELMSLEFRDRKLNFEARAYFSSPNYSSKKATTLIFINNRLVDCTPLRKSLELTYAPVLPRGGFPFIYVSLEISPEKVDPNVHPNKKEVHFLDQEEIIERICDKLNVILAGSNSSRSYHVQTLLPIVRVGEGSGSNDRAIDESLTQVSSNSRNIKALPQKMVRTDHQTRTLQSLLRPSNLTSQAAANLNDRTGGGSVDGLDEEEEELSSNNKDPGLTSRIEESRCMLKSIQDLRNEVRDSSDPEIEDLIRRHSFVGVVDLQTGFSCIQHRTELYLIKHLLFCEELFYQLALKQFGVYDRIKLEPSPSIKKLVELAIEGEQSDYLDKFGRSKAVEKICERLRSKTEMLEEYFSLKIDGQGHLETLPIVLPGYVPDMERLPLFLIRVAVECDWKNEINCFKSFLRELSFFYVPIYVEGNKKSYRTVKAGNELRKDQLKEVVFPAIKSYLLPSIDLKRYIRKITSLPELYKVFERTCGLFANLL